MDRACEEHHTLHRAAVSHCTDIMQRRKALLADLVRKDVVAVMAGDHVSPEQRLTLWMGGPRPSHSLHLMTERLRDVHPNFEQHAEALARLHTSWQQVGGRCTTPLPMGTTCRVHHRPSPTTDGGGPEQWL